MSLASFYIFAFIFNTMCTSCLGLPNTARTIHDAMSCLLYYLIIVISPVLALLPRLFIKTMKNTLKPSDDIVIIRNLRSKCKQGEKLMTSETTTRSSTFR